MYIWRIKDFHTKIACSQRQMHTVHTTKNSCTNAQPTETSGYLEKWSESNDVSSKLEMKSVSVNRAFRNRTWPSLPFREDFHMHGTLWYVMSARR